MTDTNNIYYLNKGIFNDWNIDHLDINARIAYGPDFNYEINIPIIKKIFFKGLQEIHIVKKDQRLISYILIDSETYDEHIIKISDSNLKLDKLEKDEICEKSEDLSEIVDHQAIKDTHKLESAQRREKYKIQMKSNRSEERINTSSTKEIVLQMSSKKKSKSRKLIK